MKETSIKIGAVLPFSGSEEMVGPMCLQGAKMAVAEECFPFGVTDFGPSIQNIIDSGMVR